MATLSRVYEEIYCPLPNLRNENKRSGQLGTHDFQNMYEFELWWRYHHYKKTLKGKIENYIREKLQERRHVRFIDGLPFGTEQHLTEGHPTTEFLKSVHLSIKPLNTLTLTIYKQLKKNYLKKTCSCFCKQLGSQRSSSQLESREEHFLGNLFFKNSYMHDKFSLILQFI